MRNGVGGGPTKKRIIHVSTMVRCAGRIENQDMTDQADIKDTGILTAYRMIW